MLIDVAHECGVAKGGPLRHGGRKREGPAHQNNLVSQNWEVKEEKNMSAVECRDETPSEKLDIVHGLEVYG